MRLSEQEYGDKKMTKNLYQQSTATFEIAGLSPLLTNNPIGMISSKDARGKTTILGAEESAERASYRNAEGALCIPSAGFRAGMVKAAGAFKQGRGSLKTTAAHIQPTDELLPILVAASGKAMETFLIDTRRCVIGKAGIMRSRPRYEDWSVSLSINYDPTLLTVEILQALLVDAGNRFGVGDYRPERNGWFGRYTVLAN